MIISASRRTDIPAYYSEWFFNRLREGFVLVRNPRNFHSVSRIKLSPEVVDGIVLWSKNPAPMFDDLELLRDYAYYFQFSLTPYGRDIEPNLPSKNEELVSTFKRLSDLIGVDRVIWRYDPILVNARYTVEYHIRAFSKIAEELRRFTRRVTISFIDTKYRVIKHNIKELALLDFSVQTQTELARDLAEIAHAHGLTIDTCAEKLDLKQFGIGHASCVDDNLLEKLLGASLRVEKDKSQRVECACKTSIDIGMYNTCRNGCRYCYANYSHGSVDANFAKHNPNSPLISGEVGADDVVYDRTVHSCRDFRLLLNEP